MVSLGRRNALQTPSGRLQCRGRFVSSLHLVFLLCCCLVASGAANPTAYTPRTFWMDASLGNDSNPGTMELPFASFAALAPFAQQQNTYMSYTVEMAPGHYPVDAFRYTLDNSWLFRHCVACSPAVDASDLVWIVVLPLPDEVVGIATFQELLRKRNMTLVGGPPRLAFDDVRIIPFWSAENMFSLDLPLDIPDIAPAFASTQAHLLEESYWSPDREKLPWLDSIHSTSLIPPFFEFPIFLPIYGGLRLNNTMVRDFQLQSRPDLWALDDPPSFIGETLATVHLENSIFFNNSFVGDTREARRYNGLVGTAATFVVNACGFLYNRVSSPVVIGGLFSCHNCLVSGSVFLNNTGVVSRFGKGMALHLGMGVFRKDASYSLIQTSYFSSNRFEVVPDIEFPSYQALTSGAAIGARYGHAEERIITSSTFIANEAIQGGAVHIGIDPELHPGSNFTGIEFSVTDCRFAYNYASSGLSSALLVIGIPSVTVHLRGLIFNGNTGPAKAYIPFPGIDGQGDIIDPNVMGVYYAPDLFASNLTFYGGVRSDEVHRSMFFRCDTVDVANVSYLGAYPSPGQGGFLHFRSVTGSMDLNGVEIATNGFPPLASTLFVLISVTSNTDEAFGARHRIGNVKMVSWPLEAAGTTVISASQIGYLAVTGLEIDFRLFLPPGLPMLFFNEIEDELDITHSTFGAPWAGSIVSSVHSVYIRNVNVSSVMTKDPFMTIEDSGSVHMENVMASYSFFSPFFAISSTYEVQISRSTFREVRCVGAECAALVLRQIRGAAIFLSEFDTNVAESGPALLAESSAVVISTSNFSNNHASSNGGAISVARDGSYVVLQSNRFVKNSAEGSGGAVYLVGNNYTRIHECIFEDNTAKRDGGAIAMPFSVGIHVQGSSFSKNMAQRGGAIFTVPFRHSSSPAADYALELYQSSFQHNVAKDSGGAIYSETTMSYVVETHFTNNSARTGGAVNLRYALANFVPCRVLSSTFIENNAGLFGGALAVSTASIWSSIDWHTRFINVSFDGNHAEFAGGAVAMLDGTTSPDLRPPSVVSFTRNSAPRGGVFFVAEASRVINVTGNQVFAHNYADVAGGIAFYGIVTDIPPFLGEPSTFPSLCDFNVCLNNTASGWGPINATFKSTFSVSAIFNAVYDDPWPQTPAQVHFAHFERESQFFAPTHASVAALTPINPNRSVKFYPGVSNTFFLASTDQFLQTSSRSLRALFDLKIAVTVCLHSPLCPTLTLNYTLRASHSSTLASKEEVDLTLTAAAMPEEPIESMLLEFEVLFVSPEASILPSESTVVPTVISLHPCGKGYGTALLTPNECEACPLSTFSFNGTCTSCASDPRVTCYGGTLSTIQGYYVLWNESDNAFQTLRCPSSFCAGGNQCAPGRQGVLCGDCFPGLSESILPMCIQCSKVNWPVIILLIIAIWVAALVLHHMNAVSSGKSGILIFFVQSTFTVLNGTPISEAFGFGMASSRANGRAVPEWIEWLLCHFPMNHLTRALVISALPFVMMILLTLTFGIHRLVIFVLKIVRGTRLATNQMPEQTSLGYIPLDSETTKFGFELADSDGEDDENLEDKGDASSQMEYDSQSDSGASLRDLSSLRSDTEDLVESFSGSDMMASNDQIDPMKHQTEAQSEARYKWQVESSFFHHYRLIRTLLALLASSFSSILGVIMATIGCVRLLDGRIILQNAPGISCESKELHIWRTLDYALFAPYLVFVVAFILANLIVKWKRGTLSQTDVRFGAVYEMYKPRVFAWKITEFMRRFSLSLVGSLFASERVIRASSLTIVLVAFVTVQLLAWPYRKKLENVLEAFALSSLSLISILVLLTARAESITRLLRPIQLAWAIAIITTFVLVGAFAFTTMRSLNLTALKVKIQSLLWKRK